MKIIPYHQAETVELERMYVCGNLHRLVIEPWKRDANGQWQYYRGVSWFDSMTEAVVWAISTPLYKVLVDFVYFPTVRTRRSIMTCDVADDDWVPFEELQRQLRKAGQKTEPVSREDEDDHERRNGK